MTGKLVLLFIICIALLGFTEPVRYLKLQDIYKQYDFSHGDTLDYKVYEKAIYNYKQSHIQKRIITVIDYNQPSNIKRLWVLDLLNRKVLYNCKVSHGANSGKLIPSSFSNREESHKSSYGSFVTGGTYKSATVGYALRIVGLDSFNSNVFKRGIVIHGSKYVNDDFVGRSWGCPALPMNTYRQVIDKIKDSTFLYIYKGDD